MDSDGRCESAEHTAGVLYVVATPIGNLGDISGRALDVLGGCDVIAAEDTRHTLRLLKHYGINKPLLALHQHNENERSELVLARILNGDKVALVSDAGTPLISDPGYGLVKLAKRSGCNVFAIPGACALIAALSVSGLPSHSFGFEGFIPAKGQAKTKALTEISARHQTTIFYESSHRIEETLAILAELIPEREVCIARELTKQFETVKSASAIDAYNWLCADSDQRKGEFVVLVGAAPESRSAIDANQIDLLELLLNELPPKKACAIVASHYGGDKKALYNHVIANRST